MKTVLKALALILLVLVFAEGGLRLAVHFGPKLAPGNETGNDIQSKAMKTFVQDKINRLWMRRQEHRKNHFEPPFQVFVNKDFQDNERLSFIQKYASLPAGQTTTTENFLRLNDQKENETFTVTANQLGFRGAERSVKKPKGTFRIIVLGSYPAFGHAVNDNETYEHVVEQELNKHVKGKKKFEVWNGGKQGATSIMGYARLKNEVMKYSPDLIIWDFGWIELYLARDMVERNQTRIGIKNYNDFDRFVLKTCIHGPLRVTQLCKISVKKLLKINYDDAIAGWRESMRLVSDWSKKNKVPVYFLRHRGVTIPLDEYKAFHSPAKNFFFLDTSPALKERPTQEEITEFWSRKNWMSELNFDKEKIANEDHALIFYGDAIQYNRLAYKRIGLYLANFLKEQKAL